MAIHQEKQRNPSWPYMNEKTAQAEEALQEAKGFIILTEDHHNILKIWAAIPDESKQLQLLAKYLEAGIQAIK